MPVLTVGSPEVSDGMASHGLGYYSGHYSKGMLIVVINYISGHIASGYDLHKGLRRNLNGRVDQHGSSLEFELKEPGGNPTDGTFYLTLDSATEKIAGKWVPADSSTLHSGPVQLDRMEDPGQDQDEGDTWEGDLGDLTFYDNGTCSLQYYPRPGTTDVAQMITIRGNYEHRGDTFLIEWQYNTHTPVLKMRLVYTPLVEGTDSTQMVPPSLRGNGALFSKNMAG